MFCGSGQIFLCDGQGKKVAEPWCRQIVKLTYSFMNTHMCRAGPAALLSILPASVVGYVCSRYVAASNMKVSPPSSVQMSPHDSPWSTASAPSLEEILYRNFITFKS